MIHASEVIVKPKDPSPGIKIGQSVQQEFLNNICEKLKNEEYRTTKSEYVLFPGKINVVTEQILKLYGYRICICDVSTGSDYFYNIEWN